MKGQFNRVTVSVGLAVFLVAFLLRLVGLGWGLPTPERYHSYHPDEEIVLGYSQMIQPAKGQFTPGFYNYGTFFLTLNKIASDVVSAYAGLGDPKSPEEAIAEKATLLRTGRMLNVIAGSVTALLVYLILLRRTHLIGAALGGAAIALTPAFVVHSRFLTVDVVATCLLTASLYWATRLVPEAGSDQPLDAKFIQKAAILAGLFAGLSAGTKYTGILAVVAFTVTYLIAYHKESIATKLKNLAIHGAAAAITFLLVTPGMLLDSEKFWRDFSYEITHTSTGHGLVFAGMGSGFVVHLNHLVIGYGGLLLLFSLFGVGRGCARKHSWMIGLAAFAVIVYLLIGRAEVLFLRYIFPLLPVLAVGFGWVMGQGHLRGTNQAKAVVALGVVSLGGMGGGLVSTANMTKWMTEPDVRTHMAKVIQEIAPEGSTIGLVSDPWYYTPDFYPQAQSGPAMGRIEQRLTWMSEAPGLRLIRYTEPDPNQRMDWDERLITEARPDFIVFSSFEMEGLIRFSGEDVTVPDQYADQFGRFRAFMNRLNDEYEKVAVPGIGTGVEDPLGASARQYTNDIHDLAYIRPQLWLWKRKTSSSTTPSGSSTPSGSTEVPAPTR